MESVYAPQPKSKNAVNLREAAAKYITNGRYNPMKSAVIAEEYKQRRQQAVKKRREEDLFSTTVHAATSMALTQIRSKIRY